MSTIERRFGRHIVRLEPPNVFYTTLVDDLEVEETHTILEVIKAYSREVGPIFLLLDATRLTRISPAARTASSRLDRTEQPRAYAIFGAGFHQRVLVTLVVKAFALFNKDSSRPLAFFDTEAEARVWLDEQRGAT